MGDDAGRTLLTVGESAGPARPCCLRYQSSFQFHPCPTSRSKRARWRARVPAAATGSARAPPRSRGGQSRSARPDSVAERVGTEVTVAEKAAASVAAAEGDREDAAPVAACSGARLHRMSRDGVMVKHRSSCVCGGKNVGVRTRPPALQSSVVFEPSGLGTSGCAGPVGPRTWASCPTLQKLTQPIYCSLLHLRTAYF